MSVSCMVSKFVRGLETSDTVTINLDLNKQLLSASAYCFFHQWFVAQSVERATPGEEVPGSIPAVGRPPPTGWVGVSIM